MAGIKMDKTMRFPSHSPTAQASGINNHPFWKRDQK